MASEHPPEPPRGGAPLTIRLPRLPADPAPYTFPVLATIAPVAGSLVLWIVTESVFALVFALIGPLVAVASLADARIGGRRTRRREKRRFLADVEATHRAIVSAHDGERVDRELERPGIRQLLSETGGQGLRTPLALVRWDAPVPTEVTVGRGAVRSITRLTGGDALDPAQDVAITEALGRLAEAVQTLPDAPLQLDLRRGIGFAGPRRLTLAAARACALQLARSLPPSTTSLRIPPGEDWQWMESLPHPPASASATRPDVVVFASGSRLTGSDQGKGSEAGGLRDGGLRDGGLRGGGVGSASGRDVDTVLVAVAERASELPHSCGVIVVLGEGTGAVLAERRGSAALTALRPEFVSTQEAVRFAAVLRSVAEAEGQTRRRALLPERVRFTLPTDETGRAPDHEAAGLRAVIGAAHDGAVDLDLVADGPHAVVGGATGSGKSELLVTWVLAMAARHPPDRVVFLLVDFKGGASFAPVAALPHCVGVITDLDANAASRALESLSAEVLHRERALAVAGVRAIDELPPGALPRLVILVDEFAAMSRDHPGLHGLFVDLAARGRSLGIHLILSTQRPADALRESILANCPLRISLRVSSRADSLAVIGTGDAARLPRRPEGRALISHAGEPPALVQVAWSTEEDRAAVESRWPASTVRRPWCPPLPELLPFEEAPRGGHAPTNGETRSAGSAGSTPSVTPGAIPFGLADIPAEQRQEVAAWHPHEHGHLLVLGGHRSGTSTMLAVLERRLGSARVTVVPGDVEGAWDALVGLVELTAASGSGGTGRHRGSGGLVGGDAYRAGSAGIAGSAGRAGDADGDLGDLGPDSHALAGYTAGHVVLIDDVDKLVTRFGPDHQLDFVELLLRLLRDGPAAGVFVALSARQLPSALHSAAALCPARLVLRLGSRQDHVLAGLPADRYDERMPAGRGFWRGNLVQVASSPTRPAPPVAQPRAIRFPAGGTTAIVTSGPRRLTTLLGAREGIRVVEVGAPGTQAALSQQIAVEEARRHVVLVGSPDAWQSAWSVLGSLRARVPLVFEGCTPAEFRSLSRSSRLPPPLAQPGGTPDRHVWLVTPDDRIERARLATGRPGTADDPGLPTTWEDDAS